MRSSFDRRKCKGPLNGATSPVHSSCIPALGAGDRIGLDPLETTKALSRRRAATAYGLRKGLRTKTAYRNKRVSENRRLVDVRGVTRWDFGYTFVAILMAIACAFFPGMP